MKKIVADPKGGMMLVGDDGLECPLADWDHMGRAGFHRSWTGDPRARRPTGRRTRYCVRSTTDQWRRSSAGRSAMPTCPRSLRAGASRSRRKKRI